MDSFMVEIPCSVIAELTREEWEAVCEQLDQRNSVWYTQRILGEVRTVPIFSKLLEDCCMQVAIDELCDLTREVESC